MSRSSMSKCATKRGGTSWSGLRRTPLRRYAPLRSAPVLLPNDVRGRLETRSGGVCKVGRPGCWMRATDTHHRIARGVGGRRGAAQAASDTLSNLLHACRWCHELIHGSPAESQLAGWIVAGREIPSQVPLLVRGVPSYLDDAGGVHDHQQVCA